jgi:hypothetical protein
MALEGLPNLAPTAAMLMLAVLHFSNMTAAGPSDPLVRSAVRPARRDPQRVALATARVATVVSLDGDGVSTTRRLRLVIDGSLLVAATSCAGVSGGRGTRVAANVSNRRIARRSPSHRACERLSGQA